MEDILPAAAKPTDSSKLANLLLDSKLAAKSNLRKILYQKIFSTCILVSCFNRLFQERASVTCRPTSSRSVSGILDLTSAK